MQISRGITREAVSTIDARGLHVCPGFIDAHTHFEVTLLVDPKAESMVRQGVTTEVGGNCGIGPALLYGVALSEMQARAKGWGVFIDWTTTAEYIQRLSKQASQRTWCCSLATIRCESV